MSTYLSVGEAAAALGITERAVIKRIQHGLLRADRIGARVYAIPAEEVERAQAAGRLRPGPKPRRGETATGDTPR